MCTHTHRRPASSAPSTPCFGPPPLQALEKFFEARNCLDPETQLPPSPHMCLPRKEEYVAAVQAALDRTGACHVFVASDVAPWRRTAPGQPRVGDFLTSGDLTPPSKVAVAVSAEGGAQAAPACDEVEIIYYGGNGVKRYMQPRCSRLPCGVPAPPSPACPIDCAKRPGKEEWRGRPNLTGRCAALPPCSPLTCRRDFLVDMATAAHADYFVGNCVSSFTAAVERQRRYIHGTTASGYWGAPMFHSEPAQTTAAPAE